MCIAITIIIQWRQFSMFNKTATTHNLWSNIGIRYVKYLCLSNFSVKKFEHSPALKI